MYPSRTLNHRSRHYALAGALLAGALAISACAGLPGRGDDDETVATSATEPRRDPRLNDPLPDGLNMRKKKAKPAKKAAARPIPKLPDAAVRPVRLTDSMTSLFQDPDYQKQFLDSYLSETDIEPQVVGEEVELLVDVQKLLGENKATEAAQLIKDSYTERTSAAFDAILGNIYRQADQLEEAAATYRAAVEKHPKFRRAWSLLGQVYANQEKFKESATALTKVIELGGGREFDYGLLGIALTNLGNYLAAESAFRNAAMLAPTKSSWKAYLADNMMKQQRFPEAVKLLQSLIQESPDKASLWLAQGEAYAQLKQPMRAAENFEIAEELGGSTVRSLTNLGVIYANEGLYDLSARAYVRMLEKDEKVKPEAALRAVDYMIRRGALKESRELIAGIERLRTLEGTNKKNLLRSKVSVARAEQLADEEAAVLREIVKDDPLDGTALIQLGRYHAAKEETIKAISYFQQAAGIEKFEAKAKIAQAELLVRQGKYGQAIPLLRTALALQENERVAKFLKQVERFAKKAK